MTHDFSHQEPNPSPSDSSPQHESDSSRSALQSPSVAPHEYSCAATTDARAASEAASAGNDDVFAIDVATPADLTRVVAIDQVSFSQPWSPQTFRIVLDDEKSIVLVARLHRETPANSHPAAPHEYSCSDLDRSGEVQSSENPGRAAQSQSATDDQQFIDNQQWIEAAVCGFGVATVIGDEAEIATLAVALEARGHGLGERLLRELMSRCHARGSMRILLEVRPSNANAQRLYGRLGFLECGRRRNYYADGEDALILRADYNSVSAT